MNTGQYISAGSHFGLIAYVMFGGLFFTPSDNEPVQVQEVSMISEAEFAALTRENTAPDLPDVAPQISAPVITEPAAAPANVEPTAPTESDVQPQPPTPSEPEVSLEDPGAALPDIPDTPPTPRPVPRIAPNAVVNPEQTPEVAEDVTPQVSDDAETPAPDPIEEQEAAAPQEAVTEIVTEAETPSGLSTSPRPKSRPASVVAAARAAREEQAAEAQAQSDAAANAAADAAAALVAEAVASTPAAPERPVGPPLTGGEREGLRVAVSQCWNTGSMSTEAQRTKVTVALDMNQDGTPQNGSIRLIGSSGGTSASAEQAFQTARRAIIICGKKGFPLPQDKFSQWQSIEMTFDPEQMRFK